MTDPALADDQGGYAEEATPGGGTRSGTGASRPIQRISGFASLPSIRSARLADRNHFSTL
jgi:hypothetical protein